jgi:hypothetical protein
MIPSRIEPATYRLVAKCLNCTIACPIQTSVASKLLTAMISGVEEVLPYRVGLITNVYDESAASVFRAKYKVRMLVLIAGAYRSDYMS